MITVAEVTLELERLQNEISKVERYEKTYDWWHKRIRYDGKDYKKIGSELKEMNRSNINDVISLSRKELNFIPREDYVLSLPSISGKTNISVFYDLVEKNLYIVE